MSEQNYSNHKKIVYTYYLFTGVPIIVLIVLVIWKMLQSDGFIWGRDTDALVMFLLIGWILLTMLFRSRGFALKAQDRAIRAEENLRHYVLTGKLLDKRLKPGQIIALRFASDDEFPGLAERAAEEGLSNDAIKRKIRKWRPDDHRV
jgi:hypothetical protein